MQMPDVVRVNKYPEKESGDETTLREDIDVGGWFLLSCGRTDYTLSFMFAASAITSTIRVIP